MLMEALEFCLMHYETHYRFIPLLKEFGKIYGIQYFHTSTIVEESPTRLAAASTIARGNSLLEGDRDPIDQVHLLKHGVVPTGDQDIAESAHEKDDHPSCDEDLGQGAPTNYSRSRMGFESLARKSSFRNNSASNYEQVNRSVNPNPKPNRNPSEVSLGNQEPTKTSGWLSFNGRLYRLAAQNGHAFNLPICSDLDPTEIVTIISYALTDAIKARSMRAFERILEHSKLSGCFWITLNCGLDTLLELHYSPGRDFNEMMLKSLRMEDPTLYCVSNRVIDMVFEDALGPWVALQNPKLRTMRGSVSAGLDNIQPSAPPSMNQYWGCRMLEEELCDELKTALAIVRKAEHVAELHRIPLSA
ncbi:uncharacterized protein BJ171DRAFT_514699 [Polychytrium aggregatum]|uniref:uncharacterized protein n=1 Tax=Polychytrium aggregatum TaxID=110093 RepID=UPI0022FEE05D|nr:uncharacterized protein BJ171DRAFT_514699 [Polychytrium aggregatum]KAI9202312.1 hypothetical protein BJ171DRAFT_514699 [Polychytrium aggregatum]